MIWVGTAKRPWDWKYRLEDRQGSSRFGTMGIPRYTIEGICRETDRSIFEIYCSEVSDFGLLVQKE
jgi:hypothetical protein